MASQPIAPIEIGSFTASSPQKTEFLGSASGVFFVKTVFRAFARSASGSGDDDLSSGPQQSSHRADHESVSNRLIDPETPVQPNNDSPVMRIELEGTDHHAPHESPRAYGIKGHGLGIAPKQEVAQKLLKIYLRNWHPLFPFLHGPSLLEMILDLYEPHESSTARPSSSLQRRICQAVICQCVFSIAALDWREQQLPFESRIESPTQLLSLLGFLASNHDLQSLQALLAAQLYLLSTMSLRGASTIGGTLTRVIYLAGLHRCPCRYVQIPAEECNLRKRIFWTAYILDRYLSQALGHPLSIQDSEVDVCIPGLGEFHKRVYARQDHRSNSTSGDDVLEHLPHTHTDNHQAIEGQESVYGSAADDESRKNEPGSPKAHENHGQASEILGHYVLYCRLTGQALQLFHKSLQNRTINRESIMEMQSSVHSWWNELPRRLQDEYNGGQLEITSIFTFFFVPIYNQLILLINRPFLSLSPHSLEFRTSLNNCIAAARQIITTSKHQSQWNLQVSWPGMLSMKWMAGLVLSFACTLKLYPFSKAQQEIEDCVQELLAMDKTWNNARHCAAALKSLLEHLGNQYRNGPRQLSAEKDKPITTGTSTLRRKYTVNGRSDSLPDNLDQRHYKRVNHGTLMRASSPKDNRSDQLLTQSDATGNFGNNVHLQSAPPTPFGPSNNFAIPDYNGPNLARVEEQYLGGVDSDFISLPVAGDLYGNFNGGFGNIEWESMANSWGSMQDWGSWGVPDP
ncbi:uncharacterized protein A1O9_12335 [Exophiala aquamarina CBS 119918]|uniref:Xylanolytic transcriptional activator regulatory domain-containing protein n=1 Tax=Exophiala aquamarina CBS 119918 TaxID=1182545 RepID=A0A072P7W9_9EURO|nr:uncharacterized protein A1O9_12335 [Exophiala aquamarina CBS 119918]KEF51700.1 hypothetical protein A1O9_12335 [Exophiala aquamarina CBS 119918]